MAPARAISFDDVLEELVRIRGGRDRIRFRAPSRRLGYIMVSMRSTSEGLLIVVETDNMENARRLAEALKKYGIEVVVESFSPYCG